MSDLVSCPSCKAKLRTPANATKIRCPKCQTILKLPNATKPVASAPARSQSAGGTGAKSVPNSGGMVIACPACNKKMKVAASSAGKRIKCPSCQKLLQLPGSTGAATPKPRQPASRSRGASPTPASAPASSSGSLFDGLVDGDGGLPDPSYGGSSAATDFDALPSGPSAAANPYAGGSDPYASSANPYAAPLQSAPPKRAASRQGSSSGLGQGPPPPPEKCWSIIGMVSGIAFFLTAILGVVFPPLGGIVTLIGYFGGSLVSMVGAIWVLILAFQKSIGDGLMSLLVPFYILIYIFKDWQRTWFPAMIYFSSAVAMVFSVVGFLSGVFINGQIFGGP